MRFWCSRGQVLRCRGLKSMLDSDFGAMTDVGVGFSEWVAREREISATAVPRGSRKVIPAGFSVRRTALCGRSAEASGDDLPVVAMDAGSGQMQHDAPHRGVYPGTKLQEVFAQGVDLSRPEDGTRGAQTQLLVEHVG